MLARAGVTVLEYRHQPERRNMSRKVIYALLLIALVVIILILNAGKGSISLNIIFTEFNAAKSLVLLGFTAIGVVIGVLLK